MHGQTPTQGEVGARLEAIQDSIGEIKDRLDSVGAALLNLTKLETMHTQHAEALGRAFGEIKLLQERVEITEREMPGLIEMRKWVVTGIVAGIGMVMAALFKLAIIDPAKQQEQITQAVIQAMKQSKP